MHDAQRRHEIVAALIDNPQSFWAEARAQRVCAACGRGGEFHAHHVYPKSRLKRLRKPLFDTRCALRLCVDCHMSMEWGGVNRLRIETPMLVYDNICYLWELMGPAVEFFLAEKYTGPDERVKAHVREECSVCQSTANLSISQ